jgi:hypothetical protein
MTPRPQGVAEQALALIAERRKLSRTARELGRAIDTADLAEAVKIRNQAEAIAKRLIEIRITAERMVHALLRAGVSP